MQLARRWVYPTLAIVVACLGTAQELGSSRDAHLAIALCACLLVAGAVGLLPSAPLAALASMLGVDVVYQVTLGDPPFAAFLATMIAMFHLAASTSRYTMVIGYGATLAALAAMDTVVSLRGLDSPANVVIPIVYFGAVAGIGALVRYVSGNARVARERSEALERERAHLAELAAAAERARIARDLHDVISHSVSLMVLQAEGAREVIEEQPARAAQTLEAIGETGRQAIADLRSLLGVLGGGEAPTDLQILVEPLRRAGLQVRLVQTGEPIPHRLRSTAYRVVQEALTNVVKHAAATRAVVSIGNDGANVTVEVVDDGAGNTPPAAGSGVGLAGMAQRVEALGGSLWTGHLTPSGFRVAAHLPVMSSSGVAS